MLLRAIFGALLLTFPAMLSAQAEEKCPRGHDDYRRLAPIFRGWWMVDPCLGEKVEVAGALAVSPKAPRAAVRIANTHPRPGTWLADLSGLSEAQLDELRDRCEYDLPCAGHFKLTVTALQFPHQTSNGDTVCRMKTAQSPTTMQNCEVNDLNLNVIVTLDGWR